MRLYLVRHGDSLPTNDDNKRPLSEKGKQDIQHLAEFLAPKHIEVAQFFHSEKQRARETAEILQTAIASEKPAEIRQELDPMAPIETMLEEIHAMNQDVVLVGHLPYMGKLASQLVYGRQAMDSVIFQAGTMLCLERISSDRWVILWMMTPSLFKKTG